ncbi:paraquat-inducible protein A [Cognatishimia sp. MH4019]|uniref:paraquat-inducible protein A n=1 Tax=Cognatishimia sp. MH4019 TaxID=2854030 RepID=UPI001CD7E20F|nr:paraquat-inducible protein A [Cognatishimia sp. MH4019]
MRSALIFTNLALLVLFPIAWAAPLIRAGLLPLFKLNEISVLSGIQALWAEDILLAVLVSFLALVAPYAKTLTLAALHLGKLSDRHLPLIAWLGKLAMADVFLIALYVVVIKGIGVGRIEIAWGLYLFTACILASLAISLLTPRFAPRLASPSS